MRRSARHRGSRPVLRGEKVTAVVMASDQTTRRAGEDDLDDAKARAPRDVHDRMDLYTTVDAIAPETAAPADVLQALYKEETARLNAQARLKQFVPVLAIKHVKQRLRKPSQRH